MFPYLSDTTTVDPVFNPDKAFDDTEGLGTTKEEIVADPDEIKTSDGPTPTIQPEDAVERTLRLIPGLQAFMEDTSIDTETHVTVNGVEIDGNNAADEETLAGEEEEIADVNEEIEKTDAKAELYLRAFETYETVYDHIATFGLDRTCLSLLNQNNRMGRTLNITLPSMESFTTIGDPNSPESIACLEGIKEALNSIGVFLSKLGASTAAQISKLMEAVQVRFRSIESNAKRLRARLATMQDDVARAEKSTTKVYSVDSLTRVKQAIHTTYTAELERITNEVAKIGNMFLAGSEDAMMNSLDNILQQATAFAERRDIFKQAKKEMQRVPLAQISRADAVKLIDLAESMGPEISAAQKIAKTLTEIGDRLKKSSELFSPQKKIWVFQWRTGAPYKVAKKVATALNKVKKSVTKLLNGDLWLARQCVYTAALRIKFGSSKATASPEVALEGLFR